MPFPGQAFFTLILLIVPMAGSSFAEIGRAGKNDAIMVTTHDARMNMLAVPDRSRNPLASRRYQKYPSSFLVAISASCIVNCQTKRDKCTNDCNDHYKDRPLAEICITACDENKRLCGAAC